MGGIIPLDDGILWVLQVTFDLCSCSFIINSQASSLGPKTKTKKAFQIFICHVVRKPDAADMDEQIYLKNQNIYEK